MDSFHIQAAEEGIRIPGREADVTAEKVCLEIWAVLEAFQAQGEDMEDILREIPGDP